MENRGPYKLVECQPQKNDWLPCLKTLNVGIVAVQVCWTLFWLFTLGLDTTVIVMVPNTFVILFSVAYLLVPELSHNFMFKNFSNFVSYATIGITALMAYLVLVESDFGIFALIFIFYFGWTSSLTSFTLIM